MKRYATAAALILLLAVTGILGTGCERGGTSAPTIDVTGTWKGNGYMGPSSRPLPTTLVLKQSGATVTGTWNHIPADGSVSGNKLSLSFSMSMQGQTLSGSMSFKGEGNTLVNGSGSIGSGIAKVPLRFDTLTKS